MDNMYMSVDAEQLMAHIDNFYKYLRNCSLEDQLSFSMEHKKFFMDCLHEFRLFGDVNDYTLLMQRYDHMMRHNGEIASFLNCKEHGLSALTEDQRMGLMHYIELYEKLRSYHYS